MLQESARCVQSEETGTSHLNIAQYRAILFVRSYSEQINIRVSRAVKRRLALEQRP